MLRETSKGHKVIEITHKKSLTFTVDVAICELDDILVSILLLYPSKQMILT